MPDAISESTVNALTTLLDGDDERAFLERAVETLASGLEVRWAGIAHHLGHGRAELVAAWDAGKPGEKLVYDLQGTPCGEAAEGKGYCVFEDRVTEIFPEDEHLKEIRAVSFQGKVFRDRAGHVLGHVYAMDDKATTAQAWQKEFVGLIAGWVGTEIEKRHAELAQREALATLAEDLLIARDEANAANRAKSEFLAAMGHELRTPLNAIIGFSEVIAAETFGPIGSANYRDYAKDILGSGKHLLTLINDILDLSEIESGSYELHEEKIRIPELVHSVVKTVNQAAVQGEIELSLEIPDRLPALFADRIKLKQILLHLLSNAVKFTDAGGSVILRIWYQMDSGYIFQVVDSGIGIAPEDIPKALSRFGQVDGDLNRQYEGSGLGLPLAKSFVELHGGVLDLQSDVNSGTTITARFPANRIVAMYDDSDFSAKAVIAGS